MHKGVHVHVYVCMCRASRNAIFAVLCKENTKAARRPQATRLQKMQQDNRRRNECARPHVLSFGTTDVLRPIQKCAFPYWIVPSCSPCWQERYDAAATAPITDPL